MYVVCGCAEGCFGGGGRGPERVGGGSGFDAAAVVEAELVDEMERDESAERRLCGDDAWLSDALDGSAEEGIGGDMGGVEGAEEVGENPVLAPRPGTTSG